MVRTMNIDNAEAISEYHCAERTTEFLWLARQANRCEIIVEVGSWLGATARAMADNTLGKVYAVDTFEGSPELEERLKDKPKDWLYDQFINNTKDCPRIVPVRLPSVEAAEKFKSLHIVADMIFIDANHNYDEVKSDILAWKPILRR